MELVRVKNNTEMISNVNDIAELVDSYLGYELASCLKNMYDAEIKQIDKEKDSEIRLFLKTEIFLINRLKIARKHLGAILKTLDKSKRIDKKALYKKLSDIQDDINYTLQEYKKDTEIVVNR